jgi:putative chitinase
MIDQDLFAKALHQLWPHGNLRIPGLLEQMILDAPKLFDHYGLDLMAIANFMGEATEECGGGTEVEENLNYRASVLRSQWPTHFTVQQALLMQHQPHLIANQAYNGRMGNRLFSDDGWTYRGRGIMQTTGADAYKALGIKMNEPLLEHPDLINQPKLFLQAGLHDFVEICGCVPYALRDDEVNETRHLNGGLIGLAQRKTSISLWKRALGVK